MDKSRVYRKNEQIVCKEIDGQAVLIDPYRRALVELNQSAQFIWELLDGERTVAAIVKRMSEEFDADEETLEHDADAFLKSLIRREMIQ